MASWPAQFARRAAMRPLDAAEQRVVWHFAARPGDPPSYLLPYWMDERAGVDEPYRPEAMLASWDARGALIAQGAPAWRADWAVHAATLETRAARWQRRAGGRAADNPLDPLLDILRRGYAYAGCDERGVPALYGVLP